MEDVARAIDHLAHIDEPLALDDVTVIGHSAGGHLALWAGSRSQLSPGDPGASPIIEPHTVVAQAAPSAPMGETRQKPSTRITARMRFTTFAITMQTAPGPARPMPSRKKLLARKTKCAGRPKPII